MRRRSRGTCSWSTRSWGTRCRCSCGCGTLRSTSRRVLGHHRPPGGRPGRPGRGPAGSRRRPARPGCGASGRASHPGGPAHRCTHPDCRGARGHPDGHGWHHGRQRRPDPAARRCRRPYPQPADPAGPAELSHPAAQPLSLKHPSPAARVLNASDRVEQFAPASKVRRPLTLHSGRRRASSDHHGLRLNPNRTATTPSTLHSGRRRERGRPPQARSVPTGSRIALRRRAKTRAKARR